MVERVRIHLSGEEDLFFLYLNIVYVVRRNLLCPVLNGHYTQVVQTRCCQSVHNQQKGNKRRCD